jgi:DnaJ-class molecular chaperone
MSVRCPDCDATVAVPPGAREGDLLKCPNCAGHGLRLTRTASGWGATLAHRVSCPTCDEMVTVPEGARAGDTVTCCGRRYRLTFDFGAFAAEEAPPPASP